jgi:hypothetical protein
VIARKTDDAHVCTVCSPRVAYSAVLVIGMREEKNVSHRAVNYAFLVVDYAALFRRETTSVVVGSII